MSSTELMIRSASSLLSIIDKQVEVPRSMSDSRSVRLLDHIALLFVTEANQDVTAVSAVLTANDSILLGCIESSADSASTESDSAFAKHLLVIQNSRNAKDLRSTDRQLVSDSSSSLAKSLPTMDLSYPTRRIGEDWLLESCGTKGPMGSAEHAAQLQYLLGTSGTPGFATNFARFVYYQCCPKILQRLTLPVIERGHKFKHLFSPGTIKVADLSSRFYHTGSLVLNDKILGYGDEWIGEMWKKSLGKCPAFEECDGKKYLVYDRTTVVEFHKLIGHVFALLWDRLEKVQLARQVYRTSEDGRVPDITEVQTALDGVRYLMDWLASLLKSPCFWKHLQQPALKEWVSEQYTGTMEQASRDSFNTGDEDAGEPPDTAAKDPVGAIVRWLQRATQWSVALSDIIHPNSRTTRILLSRPVKIHSLTVPTVCQPRVQSSLNSLLMHVSEKSSFDFVDAVKTIQDFADTIVSSDESRISSWNLLTKSRWNDWQTSFTGKYHCETVLASLLEMNSPVEGDVIVKIAHRAKKVIGVSKPCCFCCTLYLRQVNPNLSFGATSGRAYPWTPPPCREDPGVILAILQILVGKLQQRLVSMGTPERRGVESGSDPRINQDGEVPQKLRAPMPEDFEMII